MTLKISSKQSFIVVWAAHKSDVSEYPLSSAPFNHPSVHPPTSQRRDRQKRDFIANPHDTRRILLLAPHSLVGVCPSISVAVAAAAAAGREYILIGIVSCLVSILIQRRSSVVVEPARREERTSVCGCSVVAPTRRRIHYPVPRSEIGVLLNITQKLLVEVKWNWNKTIIVMRVAN